MLKRSFLWLALFAGCAFGQTLTGPPIQPVILVSYQIVPVPAAMQPTDAVNLGVLVIVKTVVGSIGKFDVRLDYYDASGAVHEVEQTVSRVQGRGGYDPSPIPMLFTVPVASVSEVLVEGFSPSLVPQQRPQPIN